jgi:cytochrome b561
MTKANSTRYNSVAIILHWLIFATLFANVASGWATEDLPKEQAIALMQTHKSLGITILLLSIFRLVWRHINPPPAPPLGMNAREILIMKLTHIAFYGLMIGIPLLGWVIISTSSYKFPTHFWGTFEVPLLPLGGMDFTKPLHKLAEFGHSKLVWLGIILMVLHAGAALKHQFIDKDGVLGRMLPFLK